MIASRRSCGTILPAYSARTVSRASSILSVAHEALFRVWDTLRHWLLQDRKALALRSQIEDAAAEWDTENRAESGAALVIVNREPTSLDYLADLVINAEIGPRLGAAVDTSG